MSVMLPGMFSDENVIRAAGFTGFETIEQLRVTKLRDVPEERGVYLILCRGTASPEFLISGTGGHFKGKNPTVDLTRLQEAWVNGCPVVYIGKAGGLMIKATLRSRLNAYFRFGEGVPCGHWGGRYIWQLPQSNKLMACWKKTGNVEPRDVEKKLIGEFSSVYGKRPFANRVG